VISIPGFYIANGGRFINYEGGKVILKTIFRVFLRVLILRHSALICFGACGASFLTQITQKEYFTFLPFGA
jgi:hypothetical protein